MQLPIVLTKFQNAVTVHDSLTQQYEPDKLTVTQLFLLFASDDRLL